MRSALSELAAGEPARVGAGPGGAAVEVEGLTWRPYGRRVPVLDDLTLRIRPGERVLLAGPSGCGKSTLLRALAGLLEVADAGELSGTVAVDGAPPASSPGLVAMVLQDPGAGVVAGSIDRDVAFGPENAGMPQAAIAAAVPSALAQVRLAMDPAGPTAALSGGEQQRLAVAGALALQPRVLLLDEPTSMLDPGSAASVRAAVREVVERTGLTTVVVEHRLDAWLDIADRLVVLGADGRVVADGPPLQVLDERSDDLLAQGVWVPGAPAPRPAPMPCTLFGDAAPRVRPGRAVLRANAVSVTRERRSLNRPSRVTTAVRDVSLAATAGRTLAVAGPSGFGKSTLLTVLAGLVRPTGGSVVADPAVVPAGSTADPSRWRSADLARTVAWVPQTAGSTLVARTVLDELLSTSRALGVPDATSRPRADMLLRAFSLEHLTGADPRWLSGGEQRRLAVAAAVLHRPAVLLTDEPTIGQDRLTWAAVTGVADALRRSGSAVVHATHDAELLALADDVLRLGAPITPEPVGEHSTGSTSPPSPVGSTRSTGSTRIPLAARCGPLSLLAAAALALPAALTVGSWRVGASLLAIAVVLSVVALATPGGGQIPAGERPSRGFASGRLGLRARGFRGPGSQARGFARRLVPGVLAALSVGWSAWLLGGHSFPIAAGAFLRVAVLVYPSAVVLPFVDPDRLAEHLVQRGRLPARPVVAACAALQRAQSVGDLWVELARARRVRGLGSGRSPVSRARQAAALTFAALVDSLGAAGRLAVAMDARGFAGAGRRTWLHPARWARADTVAVLLAAALPITGWLLGRLHG